MKQRMIISFEPEQVLGLKRLARERKTSIAMLVRETVTQLIAGHKHNPAAHLGEMLKRHRKVFEKGFKNVDPNLSQNVDKLLYGYDNK